MTKRITICKNTTGNREQDAEEESSASEGERETVGKPTGKTPDTQNVQDCNVFTLLSRFSLITIELEPDIFYINVVF